MDVFSREYTDLEVAIDETRKAFERWSPSDEPGLDDPGSDDFAPGEHAPDEHAPDEHAPEERVPDDRGVDDPPSGESASNESASDRPARPEAASVDGGHALRYAQLVLHEWLANLAQHATFAAGAPWVRIHARIHSRHVVCAVEDNSEGFDLEAALDAQTDGAQLLPERGMGLRIIQACTGDFAYRAIDDRRHRFEFSIPADHDPWLSTLF